MGLNFGINGDILTRVLTSGFTWIAILTLAVGGLAIFLIRRKNKKFVVPVLEIIDMNNGKANIKHTIGGWFRSQTTFFGLIDYAGGEIFKLKDKRRVYEINSRDYHLINGRYGLIVQRKPSDTKILIPIGKMYLDNESNALINHIAKSDLRETSVNIIKDAEKETMGWLDKIMPYAVLGLFIVGGVIGLVVVSQMVQHGQDKAADLILKAGEMRGGAAVASSTAPLFIFLRRKLKW